jgi:hypothetical protein
MLREAPNEPLGESPQRLEPHSFCAIHGWPEGRPLHRTASIQRFLKEQLSRLRIFRPPEYPVLSLEVQARMPIAVPPERSRFQLLVRHFLERFFNNEMVSTDGDAKTRLLQVVSAIALPGMVLALYLFAPYHAPHGRPFWSQVSDRYMYVMYSFVAMGTVSIFAWDLFFPDLLDVFVLAALPIAGRKLLLARIVALSLFLGLFLFGTNALGSIFFPVVCDLPGFAHHFFAHLLAVTASGAFAAAFFLALQGVVLAVMGERFFRTISPLLQGVSIMMLLTIFLFFLVLSPFLRVLMDSPASRYFPPFWFLGIYERLLAGSSALPVFTGLARTGCLATVLVFALAMLSYPLAYRRRTRHLVEGSGALSTPNLAAMPIHHLLHATLLRNAVQRGIYHFISYSLLRTQRHRVYLAIYGGLGLALMTACVLFLKLGHGHVAFALSPDGLRTAVPIVAFWTIAGLRIAFLSPADRRGSWLFRVILGRPGLTQLAAAKLWVLLCGMILTLAFVALASVIGPPQLRGCRSATSQALVAVGLCRLLTEALFLKVRTIPFTGAAGAPAPNLAFILLQYFGFFPPLVLLTLSLEPWLEANLWHAAGTIVIILAALFWMRRVHRRNVDYYTNLIDLDEDEEEFPQRLGLRY